MTKILKKPRRPCKEWTKAKTLDGYGQLRAYRFGRVIYRAHVLAWIDDRGQLPPTDRPNILHRCDNPACIEPTHLYAGTQARNVLDMVERKRLVIEPAIKAAAKLKRARTRCRNGHEYTPDNTKFNNKGIRLCVTCVREQARNYHKRKRSFG